jgi:DNA-binding LytR/AlgR family response regulator
MVNFIICDDNKAIRSNVISIIDKVMMKNQLMYKTHVFEDYDDLFYRTVKSKKSCKVYILDIETKTSSGIDVARYIREKDVDSIIIFLTSHDELGYTILKSEFLFLSFICKYDDYENKLKSSITKALDILGQKNIIRFEDQGALYTIPANDILYITRDSIDRKCVVKTEYAQFRINKTLTEMLEMVDGRFKQSHRACIINMDRVRVVDYHKKNIIFDDASSIDLLSASFKKEVGKKC